MLRDFEYVRPTSLPDAIALSKQHNGRARFLGGGTDLIANIKNELVEPDVLIDLKGIAELRKVVLDSNGAFIGAGVTITEIINNAELERAFPPLVEACKRLASYQVRNRATMVGNICNASPCANTVPALCVLGASVAVYDGSTTAYVPVQDFIVGVKKTALPAGALVTGVRVPATPADARGGFMEKTRIKGPDIGSASVACLVSKSTGTVRLALASLSPRPVVLDFGAQFAAADVPFDKKIEAALAVVERSISPITDVRSTAEHRMAIAKAYTKRLLTQLWEDSRS